MNADRKTAPCETVPTLVPIDDSDKLPVGSSSNTARFECMIGEHEGSILYVTELFVPRQEVSASASSEATLSSPWTAERIQRLLQQRSCSRSDAQEQNADTLALKAGDGVITEVWVTEMHSTPDDDAAATNEAVTPSISLCDAVGPFFHTFVEVVWVCAGKKSVASLTEAVRDMFADFKRQYHTPALALDTFRCFTHRTSNDAAATSASSHRASPNTPVTTTVASIATQLREPCAPSILADTRSSRVSSLWSTCLYSAPGSTFVQLLLPGDEEAEEFIHQPQGAGTRWNVYGGPHAVGNQRGSEAKAGAGVKRIAASALHHLLQVQLHLHWEGLSVAAAVPCPIGDSTRVSGSRLDAADIAVATLLDESLHTPTSRYSFVSLEQAWEAHVARSMESRTTALEEKNEECERGGRLLKDWKLRKLSTTPSLRLDELSAAVEEVEVRQLHAENPLITAAERAMLYVAVINGPPPIAPRCSTYLLHLVVDNSGEPHKTTEKAAGRNKDDKGRDRESSADEWYLLQLHAPRVQSRHAVVVCMPIPGAWLTGEGEKPAETVAAKANDIIDSASRLPDAHATARWAAALSRSYRLASYAPSLWLPHDVGRAATSGVCGRSGRLVLHVPAGEARYAYVHLAPVPAKSFTSLGSIAVWVRRDESSGCSAKNALKEVSTFVQVGAVWTLIGDGRSAATYLEDALMEYMYDTNSKNLNNVSHSSQHTRQPGVLLVRKRQRQKVKAVAASGQAAAASLLGSQEICSAWVDIGATHRLLLRVRDVGVGEVLVTEASLVGPHTARDATGAVGGDRSTEAESASRAEEEALEKWMEGIVASAVTKNLC